MASVHFNQTRGCHSPVDQQVAARLSFTRQVGGSSTEAAPTDAEIVAALRRKAEKGDAAAARELREWRDREAANALHPEAWLGLVSSKDRATVRDIAARAMANADKRLRRERTHARAREDEHIQHRDTDSDPGHSPESDPHPSPTGHPPEG